MAFEYPNNIRHIDQTEDVDYHGTIVQEKYKWLEDPHSEEVKEWIKEQQSVTESFLEKCSYREKIRSRMTEVQNYPKYSCPYKKGSRYFIYKNDGLQNQSVLYIQDSLDSEPRVYLDPNTFSEDGSSSLKSTKFSKDGEFFAYGVSEKGSDWQTINVKVTDEKNPMFGKVNEKIEWSKFSSISWTHNNKGFFYSRYPKPKSADKISAGTETDANENQQLFYHSIGTPQSDDILIMESKENPTWMFDSVVSNDGKYLIVSITKDCDPVNQVHIADLSSFNPSNSSSLKFIPVINEFIGEFSYIDNEGSIFTFLSNFKSPHYKIINIDINDYDKSKWIDVIPESQEKVLNFSGVVNNDILIVCYTYHVAEELHLYKKSGEHITQVELPTIGTITSISYEKESTEFFYGFTSYLTPLTIFRYNFAANNEERITTFKIPEIKNFNPDNFVSERTFYESKDGTKIPIFITHKKELKKDGNNPVILYGYGGFNITQAPSFSPLRTIWLQNFNGIYAVANIRGGGEYGDEWHKSGTKERKQNVFDDFQCAAEYLIKENYTNSSLIAIYGGSNGGLLVGACINQRPDLFGVAIASVGVLDMLNFHKYTIGYAWTSDYGCSDNAEDFKVLYKYSPLHNVRDDVPYPATLLTTADHDDRVVPLHSFKFIAELQSKLGKKEFQTKPLMIRIDTSAGHGAGKSTTAIIREMADIYSFIALNMNLKWKD